MIVGGGLVGATLACALKDSGLQVALVEARQESLSTARGQAYHINLLSSRIFEGLGVWDQMRPKVNPIDQIRLCDADYPQAVEFGRQDLGTEVLGFVAEHRVVLEGLQASLSQCANVSYLCPAELLEVNYHVDRVELLLSQAGEQRQVRSRLLVAADGSRSPIRQQAGIRTYGWQYWQSCVVVFVQPERSHQNIAHERFWPSGPFAILPLPNNLCRIVWTAPKAEAAAIAQLDDAEFLIQLKQRYGDQMGELAVIGVTISVSGTTDAQPALYPAEAGPAGGRSPLLPSGRWAGREFGNSRRGGAGGSAAGSGATGRRHWQSAGAAAL